jgi:hypothetical protein
MIRNGPGRPVEEERFGHNAKRMQGRRSRSNQDRKVCATRIPNHCFVETVGEAVDTSRGDLLAMAK